MRRDDARVCYVSSYVLFTVARSRVRDTVSQEGTDVDVFFVGEITFDNVGRSLVRGQ